MSDSSRHHQADDDVGHVYRGPDAELSVVRACASNADALRTAIQQYVDPHKHEVLLHDAQSVQLGLVNDDDDEQVDASSFTRQPGTLVVTSERLMFWSRDEAHVARDLAIDAACIELHALQEEPERGVYIQAQDNEADDDAAPLELTVVPMLEHASESDITNACQALFDALCKLISLHPIDPNEGDDNPFGMMMMGADGAGDDLMMGADPDMMVVASSVEATPEERERMLQRLDDMLVVPSELEQHNGEEGQFSDAEEDDNIL